MFLPVIASISSSSSSSSSRRRSSSFRVNTKPSWVSLEGTGMRPVSQDQVQPYVYRRNCMNRIPPVITTATPFRQPSQTTLRGAPACLPVRNGPGLMPHQALFRPEKFPMAGARRSCRPRASRRRQKKTASAIFLPVISCVPPRTLTAPSEKMNAVVLKDTPFPAVPNKAPNGNVADHQDRSSA